MFFPELIPGNLFNHKFIVRLVLIEGTNDIVAVTPGIRSFIVIGVTAGISIAGYIQPVLSPAFTVMRAGEKFINELAPSLERVLVPGQAELINLVRSLLQP